MGRFIPALVSIDGDPKITVYDGDGGLKKFNRAINMDLLGYQPPFTVFIDGSGDSPVATATLDEIADAFDEGKIVNAVLMVADGMYLYSTKFVMDNHAVFTFVDAFDASGSFTVGYYVVTFSMDGTTPTITLTSASQIVESSGGGGGLE